MAEYIDREALVKTLDEVIEKCEQVYPITPAQEHELAGERNAVKAIRVLVKRFDAADVKPVVHGKWTHGEGDSRWMCSVCKGKENVPTIMGKPIVWDYCPNCGARMGEKDE